MSVNSKRGQPFKDTDNKIRKELKIRVSDKMYDEIIKYSLEHDITISEIARRAMKIFLENK